MTVRQLSLELWRANRPLRTVLRRCGDLESARDEVFALLNDWERQYFNIHSPRRLTARHIVIRDNAKECIRVARNLVRSENERLAGFSALETLWKLARGTLSDEIGVDFLCEMVMLWRGITATARIVTVDSGVVIRNDDSATKRSRTLDRYGALMERRMRRFLAPHSRAPARRKAAVRELRARFGANAHEWNDPHWQIRHVVRDRRTLESIIRLSPSERDGLAAAEERDISFQITPYYLSLMSPDSVRAADRGLRAHVIPSAGYCRAVAHARQNGADCDFMQERSSSPIERVIRRYPEIVILKPYDSCPQICVYCQRNWEITDLDHAHASVGGVERAIKWIRRNRRIREVLITGGDPLTLGNSRIEHLLQSLSTIDHIERIRIGTRVLATMPMRIDNGLLSILKRYNAPGRRDIALMTHIEYPQEITVELINAVAALRKAGCTVYNQQVYTYYTSRRFETCALRRLLSLAGIIPYYTFNTKGKEETEDFRVPIARLEQERKEEARLLPGVVRTDEAVFNVPRQGKSSLNAWQDHEPIMVLGDGRRVYRFFPWESRLNLADDYLYTDVSIAGYLRRLGQDGEDTDEYGTIWYYF